MTQTGHAKCFNRLDEGGNGEGLGRTTTGPKGKVGKKGEVLASLGRGKAGRGWVPDRLFADSEQH
jgi:hypothetical protein